MFWRHAIPSKIQADSAKGILFSDVKKINKIQHTLTAWETKQDMIAYIHSGSHLQAMKAFRKIAVGKTFGYG
jgi:heme-degrading monooxygenase HmoA